MESAVQSILSVYTCCIEHGMRPQGVCAIGTCLYRPGAVSGVPIWLLHVPHVQKPWAASLLNCADSNHVA